MKTSVFKVFCSVFAIACLMSSCLGDGDSSYSSTREFTYIYQDEYGKKYAVTTAGYITHSNIDALIAGNCYYIAYKITTGTGTGIFQAESVEVLDKGKPIPSSELRFIEPYSDIPNRNDTITPLSLQIGAWSPGTTIGDNWEIGYKVNLKEDEKVKAYFYFDPEGQKKEDGTELEKNQIIIDVRFAYIDRNEAAVATSAENLTAVGVLEELRRTNYFTPVYDSDKDYANVAVRFRYQKNEGDKPASIQYIGSWTSTSSIYYIQFTRNN
ncbi:hypothetical protein JGH11_12280 [Dysgonomonas sp. Marseille-P4677]|uniref:hypothetical protein n=1 Tax=Dysgonomonas sp. Marseille-P4677 TaxID=2364790 RepID=UPI0019140062|nr:hypothetical protein [Dysgonomonas sp. Marseille-P4677]MBK5721649.1 hypothetical protein [Dysgonomonas sp. Marseille-P4677]